LAIEVDIPYVTIGYIAGIIAGLFMYFVAWCCITSPQKEKTGFIICSFVGTYVIYLVLNHIYGWFIIV